MWWALALALGSMLGCDDPPGNDADGDGVPAHEDCDDSAASRWRTVTRYADSDADGIGAGEPVTLCLGFNVSPGGYAEQGTDCAPGDGSRWRTVDGRFRDGDGDGVTAGEAQSACLGNTEQGWRPQPSSSEDCDDSNALAWKTHQVYPDMDGDGAGEGEAVLRCAQEEVPPGHAPTATDCAPGDGTRWQVLAYHFRDADVDGTTVAEEGQVCAGTSLPPGYTLTPFREDCDDTLASRWQLLLVYRDTDGDGVGSGPAEQRCSGAMAEPGYSIIATDCAPDDGLHWQVLGYLYRDGDGDGETVSQPGQVCSGTFLPPGYLMVASGLDCDDTQASRFKEWNLFPDTDGDGVGAGSREELCAGTTRPAGYGESGTDCAPTDATRWQGLTYQYRDADSDTFTVESGGSLCAGATLPQGYTHAPRGNDCNDQDPGVYLSLQGHVDSDADGVGAGAAVTFCTAGTLPAGHASTGTDCAEEDATRWQLLTYAHVDGDGDTHTTPVSGQVCTGAQLPLPYFAVASGNDCDDTDPSRFHARVLYPDADGDGVGRPPRVVPCLGTALPAGHSVFGFDPDDTDASKTEPSDDGVLEFLLDD
jgi:hypothetical protein